MQELKEKVWLEFSVVTLYSELVKKIVTCRLATEVSVRNEILRLDSITNRPEKTMTITWRTAPDALKQSFTKKS